MKFRIIGRKFSPAEFAQYLESLPAQSWVKRIVLHNTASPSLTQRPGGILTAQHIDNLHRYYENEAGGSGWSGGPHLFIDAEGIWVFNPLDDPGVHSPSYNSSAWGVEMLGDYNAEPFDSGLGAKVRDNAAIAVALLMKKQGWKPSEDRLLLHKEDPATTHDCPGRNVTKAAFLTRVKQVAEPRRAALSLTLDGKAIAGAFISEGRTFAPVRDLAEALGLSVEYDAARNTVVLKTK